MAVSAYKVFSSGEVLTAADLNASFAQVFDNGEDLGWPATQTKDLDGQQLTWDADADTYFSCTTDDILLGVVGGETMFELRNDGSIATRLQVRSSNAGAAVAPKLTLFRSSASPAASDVLGGLEFDGRDDAGNQHTYAAIRAEIAAATNGFEDGELVFYRSSGSGTLTEMMRLDVNGLELTGSVGSQLTAERIRLSEDSDSSDVLTATAESASYTGNIAELSANRAANSGFDFLETISDADGTPDAEHRLLGDGTSAQDGGTAWTSGAGFAEMFEWADGNPTGEDRVGVTVAFDGAKVRPAAPGDTVVGVITGIPAGVGNAGALKWHGRYKRDRFGRRLRDENGRRVQSEDFDPAKPYISRMERAEWACVSLLGQEIVRDGQPTGDRWIKMEQRPDGVSLWLVR